jgi:predicted O-linked N-acetylglucosamine transferase (SPINDLY family)
VAGRLYPRFFGRVLHWIGNLFQRRGNPSLAIWFFREAGRINPASPNAEYARAKALRFDFRRDEALGVVERLLIRYPRHVPALNLRGVLLLEQGELNDAELAFNQAISIDSGYAPGWNNLGNVALERDALPAAEKAYRRSLSCDRNYIEALSNLGMALNRMARYEEAEQHCRRAVAINPDFAGAHNNLANVLLNLNRAGEAERHYRDALRLQPDLPEAHINLAIALGEPAYLVGAIDYYEDILQRNPKSFLPHLRLGMAYAALDQFDLAEKHYLQARDINPDSSDPIARLGDCYARQAFLDEAIDLYEQCLEIVASQREAVADGIQQAQPDWPRDRCEQMAALPASSIAGCLLFTRHYHQNMSGFALCHEAKRWAVLSGFVSEDEAAFAQARKDVTIRKLKVGYVSRDFFQHSVAFFLEPLLASHDHDQFQIFGYCNLNRPDAVTERLKRYCDEWRDIHMMSDNELVELVREDAIDILVDLSGHTSGNRLGAFALRSAPIQMNYLGYPGTTGLTQMDARLTDAIADPPGESDQQAVERLVRLPGCFVCFRPVEDAPSVATLPVMMLGHITFGSFNNPIKVTNQVIEVWSQILGQIPDSRLAIKGLSFASERAKDRYLREFQRWGVEPERLDLLPRTPGTILHLESYGLIDIALDSFPYNGTTTTCESLWMGVPVVTYVGNRHSARVGASILHAVGMDDWIGKDIDDYVRIAVAKANTLESLARLRAELRQRMRDSRLTDAMTHAKAVESAYRNLWTDYCTTSRLSGTA